MNVLLTLLGVGLILAIMLVFTYHNLLGKIENIRSNERRIDLQLERRFASLHSLMRILSAYEDFQASCLKDVPALHMHAQTCKDQGEKIGQFAAETEISRLFANFRQELETHPQWKSDENALQLQEEIVTLENRLSFAKQTYNDSIEIYNATKQSFPASLMVCLFHNRLNKGFSYWNISERKRS